MTNRQHGGVLTIPLSLEIELSAHLPTRIYMVDNLFIFGQTMLVLGTCSFFISSSMSTMMLLLTTPAGLHGGCVVAGSTGVRVENRTAM